MLPISDIKDILIHILIYSWYILVISKFLTFFTFLTIIAKYSLYNVKKINYVAKISDYMWKRYASKFM